MYNWKHISPRALIKVDIRKVYDTVKWHFLLDVLVAYKFPQKVIEWIKACVQTVSYSLVLNGEPSRRFRGRKDLRQGDPLSPLLFVLVMDYLTRMFSFAARDARFHFHPLCQQQRLTNLAFADDLLVFCKGDSYSVAKVKVVMEKFAVLSGLHANLNKSNIYMGGLSDSKQQLLLQITGFQKGVFR